MSQPIILKLNAKTARRLAYVMGRSDEANGIVQAATNAAKTAEQAVRDLISVAADQTEQKLPEHFHASFDEESNEVTITSTEGSRMNGQEVQNA